MKNSKFVQPGAFSRAYHSSPPTRELQGGRRQTQIFEDKDKINQQDVHKLLNHARSMNNKNKLSNKQQKKMSKLSSPKNLRSKSPTNSPVSGHTWGRGDRFSSQAEKESLSPPPPPEADKFNAINKQSKLVLPEAPMPRNSSSLGKTLSTRAVASTSETRLSSSGTILRRGSQVDSAPRRQVRQYRHPREMEAALIDSESKIALLEDKLDATTSVLRRTQKELLERNADLEAANMKTKSLLLMVQELLQHVVEKREGRRFSETASVELQKILESPTKYYEENNDMKEYIEGKINAIDDLLPKWTTLSTDFMSDVYDNEDSDDDTMSPPPIPFDAARSRR
jgi:hypothetical protein